MRVFYGGNDGSGVLCAIVLHTRFHGTVTPTPTRGWIRLPCGSGVEDVIAIGPRVPLRRIEMIAVLAWPALLEAHDSAHCFTTPSTM